MIKKSRQRLYISDIWEQVISRQLNDRWKNNVSVYNSVIEVRFLRWAMAFHIFANTTEGRRRIYKYFLRLKSFRHEIWVRDMGARNPSSRFNGISI